MPFGKKNLFAELLFGKIVVKAKLLYFYSQETIFILRRLKSKITSSVNILLGNPKNKKG